MVAPWVLPAVLGGAQTALGFLGQKSAASAQATAQQAEWDYRNAVARSQYRAQQAAYQDAIAFQAASEKYARWAAEFNAGVTDLNNQYQYWQQTINYNQEVAFINSQRNVELTKAINQAKVVKDTRIGAMVDFSAQSEALGQALQEEATRDAMAQYQYRVQASKASADVRNTSSDGPVIDRLMGDYARQMGDMRTAMAINEGFRKRQFSREQAAAVAGYLSRYNSQPFYERQRFQDPIPPFPPMPTLIAPPPPTSTGPGPTAPVVPPPPQSGFNSGLALGTAALQGLSTGINAWQSLQRFTGGGPFGGGGFSSSVGWSFPSSGLANGLNLSVPFSG